MPSARTNRSGETEISLTKSEARRVWEAKNIVKFISRNDPDSKSAVEFCQAAQTLLVKYAKPHLEEDGTFKLTDREKAAES